MLKVHKLNIPDSFDGWTKEAEIKFVSETVKLIILETQANKFAFDLLEGDAEAQSFAAEEIELAKTYLEQLKLITNYPEELLKVSI